VPVVRGTACDERHVVGRYTVPIGARGGRYRGQVIRPTSRPTSARALACGIAVLLALAGVAVSAPAAYAHDVLRSSDPADGSTVPVAPQQVTLTFDAPALALGTQVVVLTPDGRDAAAGEPVLAGSTVTQAVDGALPAGEYTVEWRVTSSDGHTIDGTFGFTAIESSGETPATPAPTTTSSDDPTTAPTASPTTSAAPTPSASALPVIDPGPAGGGPAAWLVGGLIVLLVIGGVVVVVSAARDSRRP
jgi:copper resistance protein C